MNLNFRVPSQEHILWRSHIIHSLWSVFQDFFRIFASTMSSSWVRTRSPVEGRLGHYGRGFDERNRFGREFQPRSPRKTDYDAVTLDETGLLNISKIQDKSTSSKTKKGTSRKLLK